MKFNPIKPLIRSRLYKSLRLGLPVFVMLTSIFLFFKSTNNFASWYLLLSFLAFVLLEFSLREDARYIDSHASIMRVDLLFLDFIRPIFRIINKEELLLLSFFKWNNEKVYQSFLHNKSRRTLLLLPHCIQWSNCSAPILDQISSCYNCGLCPIENLVEDSARERWDVRVTNRSYKAYIEAKKSNPDLIVAVSCVDRLLKGIRKLASYPSFLIPLELPHGMCVNATFNYNYLESAMSVLATRRDTASTNIKILKHG